MKTLITQTVQQSSPTFIALDDPRASSTTLSGPCWHVEIDGRMAGGSCPLARRCKTRKQQASVCALTGARLSSMRIPFYKSLHSDT